MAKVRAVVAGWFSYRDAHATAGDLLASDVLCQWLTQLGIEHVRALAPPVGPGPELDALDPGDFTHAFFVCGPWQKSRLEADFIRRFAACRLIGINLSLDDPPADWRPFDLLIERDSIGTTNADLVFASRQPLPPIVGVCLVEPHPEADVNRANAAIRRLLARRELAVVAIDTRLDVNATGLRTKGEVEAAIARMDAVITTRLHGLVLALKNGVPALAIDAVRGSGKIKRQCDRIGWPNVLTLDDLTDRRLDDSLAFALSSEARAMAARCARAAATATEPLREQLASALTGAGELEHKFAARQTEQGAAGFRAELPDVLPVGPNLLAGSRTVIKRLRARLRS